MQERQLAILTSLLYSSTPRSTEALMAEWSVSERTIKYDLSQLRAALKVHGIKLLNKKGIGYYFSPADKPKLIDAYSLADLENTQEQIQSNVLLYTLFVKSPALLTDVAERLFFDVSTIKRYVGDIELEQTAIDAGIVLQLIDGTKFSVLGPELPLRKFYVSLFQHELKTVQSIELKFRLQQAFPLYEEVFDTDWFTKAEEQLKVTISKHSLWISEWSFEYLTLYLYVMYLRQARLKRPLSSEQSWSRLGDLSGLGKISGSQVNASSGGRNVSGGLSDASAGVNKEGHSTDSLSEAKLDNLDESASQDETTDSAELSQSWSLAGDVMTESFKGERAFAEDVLKQLYWGKVAVGEVAHLVQVMLEQNIFSEQALDASGEARLKQVISSMLAALAVNYPEHSFDQASLTSDLTPHLKQIIRKKQLGGHLTPNPLFHQVKQKYRQHYQMAQLIYRLFSKAYGIDYSDNEASLLAIYLYKNSQDLEQKTYTAYLVCGTGRGFSKLLETRLHNIFPNVEVMESLSSYHLLKQSNLAKVDLIISTISLPESDIPVVKISSFLGRKDIQSINQVLEYGTTASDLPFASEEIPVLNPSPTYQTTLTGQESPLLKENALTFSNILLDLYSTMVSLPDGYQINQEKLLGISIHLIIALPRYFEAESIEHNQEIVDEVIAIEKKHKALAREMNAFLNRVEQTLGQGIPYMERYALYQYILT